ncbi:extracellular mutant protein 11-domain-containing protein [Cadophora sp. MPI-SDFR-AT-0126]|nr:extracellular mutant protein 11-domain-containing protein [Leotiomycetes sp. MPI-SDFR-AT-0126]
MNRFVQTRAQNGHQNGQNGRAPTSPLGQSVNGDNGRPDRSSARDLKFSKKSGNTTLTNTEPLPGYTSNQVSDANLFSHNLYQQVEYGQSMDGSKEAQYQKDILEETTVGSDFDRTKSDIGFELEQYDEYNEGGFSTDDGNGYIHDRRPHVEIVGAKEVHTIQYKQSRSPLRSTKTAHQTQRQQPLAIAGRFEANKQHQDLQLRSGHGASEPHRDQGSRKRSRSGGALHAQVTRGLQQEVPDDGDDEADPESAGGQADATVRLGDVHLKSDGTEQATPVQSPIRQRKSRTLPQVPSSQNIQQPENPQAQENLAIDDRLIPDYSDAELKLMKYSDLDGENWDMVPKATQYKLPAELHGRKVTMEMKIAHHLKLDPEHGQLPFYENLSTEEWEQAGDLFIEKFAELMKKLKEKKRVKRETASQFENEIKEREKAVRDHATMLDTKLEGMEVAGKSLLGTKKKRTRG